MLAQCERESGVGQWVWLDSAVEENGVCLVLN